MIRPNSFNLNWIEAKSDENRNADVILLEKVIWALHLLEQIQLSPLEFTFKGGTSLMLLLNDIKRFSIDIDIIVSERSENIEETLQLVTEQSNFNRFEEDVRNAYNNIDKAHYKFYYTPQTPFRGNENYILLDIVYADSPYGENTVRKAINSQFLDVDEQIIEVTTPSINAILGDKLTAFAPKTTGIPYGMNKEIEIIKQMFDVGNLFNQMTNVEVVKSVFEPIAQSEINYRSTSVNIGDVLEDIYQTSLCISRQGQEGDGNFTELQIGIRNIRNYIFSERFEQNKATIAASKSAYVAMLISKVQTQVAFYESPNQLIDLEIPGTRLGRLKRNNPEAFFYWYQAKKLRGEA